MKTIYCFVWNILDGGKIVRTFPWFIIFMSVGKFRYIYNARFNDFVTTNIQTTIPKLLNIIYF